MGTVIIACWTELPPEVTLRTLLTGKATQLKSQFRLTYSMILSLLRVNDLSVEDMIRRSFSEFKAQRALGNADLQKRLRHCERELFELKSADVQPNEEEDALLVSALRSLRSHLLSLHRIISSKHSSSAVSFLSLYSAGRMVLAQSFDLIQPCFGVVLCHPQENSSPGVGSKIGMTKNEAAVGMGGGARSALAIANSELLAIRQKESAAAAAHPLAEGQKPTLTVWVLLLLPPFDQATESSCPSGERDLPSNSFHYAPLTGKIEGIGEYRVLQLPLSSLLLLSNICASEAVSAWVADRPSSTSSSSFSLSSTSPDPLKNILSLLKSSLLSNDVRAVDVARQLDLRDFDTQEASGMLLQSSERTLTLLLSSYFSFSPSFAKSWRIEGLKTKV